ncbi:FtsX-like permease family protein [Luteococcus sp. Sow4_B9]|uniref:FtsX-like permease family protein n=1 Tax=Luteococcus sp. Sow4_B9 TaxID=3438792 RepID=UPI003F9C0985
MTRLAFILLRRKALRSGLITACLALPLAVAVSLLTLQASSRLSVETKVSSMIGASRATLSTDRWGSTVEESLTQQRRALPATIAGTATPEIIGPANVRLDDREVASIVYGLEESDQHTGRFILDKGRWPTADGEAMIAGHIARFLDIGVGDEIRVGDASVPLRVVGLAAVPTDTTRAFVVTSLNTASTVVPVPSTMPANQPSTAPVSYIVWHCASEPSPSSATEMEAAGWQVKTRAEFQQTLAEESSSSALDETTALTWSVLLFVLLELGLVIFAVYLVASQSLRRETGLLATLGADRHQLMTMFAAQGLLTGVAGVLVGLGCGLLIATVLRPWFLARQSLAGATLVVPWSQVSALGLLVLLLPTIASWVAARPALTETLGPSRRRAAGKPARHRFSEWPGTVGVFGLSLLVLAAMWQFPGFTLAGSLATLLSAAGVLHRHLRKGRASARGSAAPRIAAGLTTSSPVRTATMALVIGTLVSTFGLLLGAYGGKGSSVGAQYQPTSPHGSSVVMMTRSPQPSTVLAIRDLLAGHGELARFAYAAPPEPTPSAGEPRLSWWGAVAVTAPDDFPVTDVSLTVAERGDLERMIGRSLTQQEEAAWNNGTVLVTDDRLSTGGVVTLSTQAESLRTMTPPALAITERSTYSSMPTAFISAEGIRELGGSAYVQNEMWVLPGPVDEDLESKIRGMLSSDIGSGWYILQTERGSRAAAVLRAMLGYGLVTITLIALALGFLVLALSGAELRPVLASLSAVGADARWRTRVMVLHTGQVLLWGMLLATAVLVLAVPSLLITLGIPLTVWPLLAVLSAGLGLAIATVVAGRCSPIRPDDLVRRVQ